ncbi:type II toxin-antitoxin system RelE/ParE family toxin [bacterium]|nr:type II toxin-antitoxin system RelE/ParE family toxin [bacterium]MCB2012384.1 type II toxin-antitoxin system RelE/ParE family toxin [Geminicoccaceae bacterium]
MRIRYTRLALSHLRELKATSMQRFGVEPTLATLQKIDSAIRDLVNFPERGRPGRITGTRELVITGTPFLVAYRLHQQEIHVLAILHGARKWPSGLQ